MVVGAGWTGGGQIGAYESGAPTILERIIAVAPTKILGLWCGDDVVLAAGKIAQISNQVSGGLHLGQSNPALQHTIGSHASGKALVVAAGGEVLYTCVTPAGGAANLDLSAQTRVAVIRGASNQDNTTTLQVHFQFSANWNVNEAFSRSSNDPANHSQFVGVHDQANSRYCGGYVTLSDSGVSRCTTSVFDRSLTGQDQVQLWTNGVKATLTNYVGAGDVLGNFAAAPFYVGADSALQYPYSGKWGMTVLVAGGTESEERAIETLVQSYYL